MSSLVEVWQKSALRTVFVNSKSWAYWIFKRSGGLLWILGTTLIIVGFPLVLEVSVLTQLFNMQNNVYDVD